MSTNLYYEPVKPSKAKTLGDGLKWAIQKYYGSDHVFTRSDIGFLKGVKAAQFKSGSDVDDDCDKLIEVIEQYGEVRVWIEE